MKTYSVNREHARRLHNGVCYLRDSISHLENVLNEGTLKGLKSGFKEIESLRKYLYDIIDREDDETYNRAKRYAEENGINNTIWSYYDESDFSSNHGFPVGCTIQSKWESENTTALTGSTWGDLWKDINRLVKDNMNDFGSHVFIENFKYDSKTNILNITFGS